MSNVSKGVQSYNASYFTPNSSHEISTRTVDTYSNVNATWFNDTATTSALFTYVFGFVNDIGIVSNFSNARMLMERLRHLQRTILLVPSNST